MKKLLGKIPAAEKSEMELGMNSPRMQVNSNYCILMEGAGGQSPFGMQSEQSCKTDRINMKTILLKSRRYNRGQPE